MDKVKKGVRLEHISKIYQDPKTGKDFYAVKDTSLTIEPGSFVTLLGPSGCGKTTLLNLLVGKDEVKDGGIPNVNRLGIKKFIKYASFMVLLHSTVFFIFETLSLHFFYLTLLRILLSSAVTLLLVYFCQRLFSVNRQKP